MAGELKHKTVGTGLSRIEWEAVGGHEASGQTLNDMLYFNGSYWVRADAATIATVIGLDAKAIVAAKTIKLDDFATPDDNTDLNATTTEHGLLRKLDNVVTNFLNGQGGWSIPAPTKEFFAPVTVGSDMELQGTHPGALIDAAFEKAGIEFLIPADYSSITLAKVIGIALGADINVAFPMRIQAQSNYGILDEGYQAHQEIDATRDNAEGHTTVNDLISWDISGILSSLTIADHVGIQLLHVAGIAGVTNSTNSRILGVWFKYS